MTRPRIGVTVSRRSGWRIYPLMALNILRAGGRPVRWQSAADVDIADVDGVVIGGGDDISPTLYGSDLVMEARLDHARDALEKWIIEAAFQENLPVLGICRGAQMLNVVLGGTLDQDAYTSYPSRRYRTILPRKRVEIERGTLLEKITGPDPLHVNALHSQAVDRLGRDVRVAARDDGGMIQAIERTRDPFAVGVQWHPEHLIYKARHRALFTALVAASRAASDRRRQIPRVEKTVS